MKIKDELIVDLQQYIEAYNRAFDVAVVSNRKKDAVKYMTTITNLNLILNYIVNN